MKNKAGQVLPGARLKHAEERKQQKSTGFFCYHVCTIIFIIFHTVYGAPEEVVFADEEWELFERRVEEGYDLCPSGRYLLWLRMYYPHLVFEGGYTPELKVTMYMYMYIFMYLHVHV